MSELSIAPLLILGAGTVMFMVAGLAVCIGITIFTDTINLGGSFDNIAEKIIALVFIPILLFGKAFDLVADLSVPAEIKKAMNTPV